LPHFLCIRCWANKKRIYFVHAGSQEADPNSGFGQAPASPGKTMEALQRVKLDGYAMVISELETELDYLRRATRYLEE